MLKEKLSLTRQMAAKDKDSALYVSGKFLLKVRWNSELLFAKDRASAQFDCVWLVFEAATCYLSIVRVHF